MNTTKKSIMKTKPKNNPLRKCVGCNEMKEKESMIRVTKDALGGFQIDETHTVQSRGAYICKNADCLKKTLKNKGLERSLKCKISDDFYQTLEQVLNAYENGSGAVSS